MIKKYNIAINDLYRLVADKLYLAKLDRFHWKAEGYKLMTNQTITFIQKALENRNSDKFIQLSPGDIESRMEILCAKGHV